MIDNDGATAAGSSCPPRSTGGGIRSSAGAEFSQMRGKGDPRRLTPPAARSRSVISVSPHRLPRALRPFAIVFLAADGVVAHLGEDLAGCRQAPEVDALVGIPEIGAHDGARALEVNLL